jgi:hypothetical protein
MKKLKSKFKELFADVEENVGDIIELQLHCVEERMDVLDSEGRYKDLIALGQEYAEWANAEDGDNYGFLFVGPIEYKSN